jgi:heme exporter protein C
MRHYWWKIVSVVLLLYTFTAGFLTPVPDLGNLHQSIRNFYFHVPMWATMMTLFSVSVVNAVRYLRKPDPRYDLLSGSYAGTGIWFSLLGLLTGMIWAKFSWGEFWSNDPKQLGAAIAILIYLAYGVLRNSITDLDKRGRVSAVYNIFAYCILFPTLLILPRMVQSLHPGGQGAEGNPGLGGDSLDPIMARVFFPAMLGWTLLGVWISTLQVRYAILNEKKHDASIA